MFRVSARTVLQLGAERIRSDAFAFYELTKNAFDAGSKRVVVRVVERLPSEKIAEFKELLHSVAELTVRNKATQDTVRKVRELATTSVLKTAPEISGHRERIEEAHMPSALLGLLDEGSSIEFSDSGEGMSLKELNEVYLTIGTNSRIKTRTARASNRTENDGPVLGEKGIGRLSAMRLGMKLEVRTAKKGESKWNVLSIDWRAFPQKSVRQEFEPKGYQRESRLKLPYAVEVQQHLAAQLTQVGVPTPTPVVREHSVVVYGKAADGTFLNVGTVSNGVVVFHHKDSDQFVLTVDCINDVLHVIDRFAAQVAREIEADRANEAAGMDRVPRPAAAPAATSTQPRRGGVNVVRDASQEAATKACRRKKYLDDLREARDALSRNCRFEDSLCKIPAIDQAEQHIDTISETKKLTRIEVRHATSLSGKFLGNAPVVLAFALPKATNLGQPEVDEASMAGIVQRIANLAEGVRATP